MGPFEMVVAIVGIVTLGSIVRAKHGSRNRRGGAVEAEPGEANRLRDEVRTLKDRIAVLERLVTDDAGPRALEREIDALRSRDA